MVLAKAPETKQPTLLKIDNKWVNVEIWKQMHPGGAAPLERYAGKDCTDAFVALHSREALNQVARMKAVDVPRDVAEQCNKASEFSLAFRKWRAQLEADGFFERRWAMDALNVALMLALVVGGYALAWHAPLLSVLVLGFGMQQAGWIGHDYAHGRGRASWWLGRCVAGLINAFSPEWWSDKHNTHHVHPNQAGVDSDIANDPILHLYVPESAEKDFVLRPYQHFYYHFAYMFLYASWRAQSLMFAWRRRNWQELSFMAINYALLAMLPFTVAVGSVLVGGFFVAEVVTATHQSEDMIDSISHEFVYDQFRTTRDVHMTSSLANYFWGGMQYQLVHHLFPTMPRYNYPRIVPLLTEFAKQNNVEYRTAGPLEIFLMNYNTMAKYATDREAAKKFKAQ